MMGIIRLRITRKLTTLTSLELASTLILHVAFGTGIWSLAWCKLPTFANRAGFTCGIRS